MPKVSVIIPCYNQGQFLDEAVNSVLSQTYQDFEIIIVNDGSTDDFTTDILKKYSKPKTQVIQTDNQGLASARNNGIAVAKGRYILPLDADDKIGKKYLEEAVKVLDGNPGIGIVYCKAKTFGAFEEMWELPEYSLEKMLIDNIIFCSAFFRRKDWEEIGGYDSGMVYGWEDYDFWLSLIEKGVLVYRIPKVLFYYRVLLGSMVKSTTKGQKTETFIKIFHKHRDLFMKNINIWVDKIIEDHTDHVVQLYIDTGLGFNVNQVVSQIISGRERKIEFDLSAFKGRFDPIDDYCVLHIENIIMVRENNATYELSDYRSNAVHQTNGDVIFTTNDPQIFLDIFDEKIQKVIINLEYIAMGKDTLGYFGKVHADLLLEEEIARHKQVIDSLQSTLDAKILAYESLLQSISWKMTAPLRWLNNKVKDCLSKRK